MEKIKRYRETQKVSFEDFFNLVTDTGVCKCCKYLNYCIEMMGEDNVEALSGYGCREFDNSVDKLKNFFLIEQCVKIGT